MHLLGTSINRTGQFYLDCTKAQLDAAGDFLDGLVIWRDMVYKKGMFFSPDYRRMYFKPWVKAVADYDIQDLTA